MDDWRLISSAPKDGRAVRLRRVYDGRVICEGEGVFDFLADDAPMRLRMDADPLGRMSPQYMALEAAAQGLVASERRWLKSDRRHAFPEPTHWQPLSEA